VERIAAGGFVIEAVEDAFVVADIVDRQEFRRVQKMAGANACQLATNSPNFGEPAAIGAFSPQVPKTPVGLELRWAFAPDRIRSGIDYRLDLSPYLGIGRAGDEV